jgi:uncharacterized membrane protein YbhN (UPF0104 family)
MSTGKNSISLDLKNYLRVSLVTLATILVFWLLFRKINFNEVIGLLISAKIFYLLMVLVLTLVFPFLLALRWRIMLSGLGHRLGFMKGLFMILGAYPLNSITPSKAGDVIKAYFLRKDIEKSKVFGTVLCERFFDVLVLVLLCGIGAILVFDIFFLLISVAILCILLLGLVVLSSNWNFGFRHKFLRKIDNVKLCFQALRQHPVLLLKVFTITLVIWIISVIQSLFFFYALGVYIPFLSVLARIPIAIFVGMIPVTLGGMGTRDGAIIYMFSGFASSESLLGVGILFSLFRYWLLSLIGIPFFIYLMNHMKNKKAK